MHVKNNCYTKINLHWKSFTLCRNVFCANLQKSAFGKIFALQICAFLCTTVFRTFADLHIYILHLCRKFANMFCVCAEISEHVKIFWECARTWNLHFSQIAQGFSLFEQNRQNLEKAKFPKMSDSVPSVFDVFPKMSEKSSRVPEWYTSGSWANAFDNTGWQKSPEYALIRIAAGAPDLAKSPNPPPDGPGRPRKSRHFSLRTEKLPDSAQGSLLLPRLKSFPELFFLIRAQLVRVVKRIPRRVEFCDRVRHILQMCAHFAKHSLKTAVRANDIPAHRAHRAHPKHNRAHLCTPRHNSRHKWQRTHRPCVALVGRREVRSVHEQ